MTKKTTFEIDTKIMTSAQIILIQGKEDSILNTISGKMTVQQKEISDKDWRLVHDDVKVVTLIAGEGITCTLDKASEFVTEELALAEIEKLKLDDSALNIEVEMSAEGKVAA